MYFLSESATGGVPLEKLFLKYSEIVQKITCVLESLFNKLAGL